MAAEGACLRTFTSMLLFPKYNYTRLWMHTLNTKSSVLHACHVTPVWEAEQKGGDLSPQHNTENNLVLGYINVISRRQGCNTAIKRSGSSSSSLIFKMRLCNFC